MSSQEYDTGMIYPYGDKIYTVYRKYYGFGTLGEGTINLGSFPATNNVLTIFGAAKYTGGSNATVAINTYTSSSYYVGSYIENDSVWLTTSHKVATGHVIVDYIKT